MTLVLAATALLTAATLLAGGGWPLDDPSVVSGFRPPDHDWEPGHRGVDLAARPGDPVLAMTAGTVGFVGTVAGTPVVTILLADGRRLTHEPVRGSVPAGARVREGQVIGSMAAAGGHCGGRGGCLHVGLRTGDGYADPLSLVGRRPAVLKPR
jgi:murein DD-endopeptidase MepM/ murein hydrolase activator NlpD